MSIVDKIMWRLGYMRVRPMVTICKDGGTGGPAGAADGMRMVLVGSGRGSGGRAGGKGR